MTHIKPYPSPRPTSLIALTLNSNSFPMIKFWTFAWQWRTLSNATYHSPSGPDFLSLFSTWYPISSQLPSSFGAFHLRRAAVPMTSSMTKDRTLLFYGSYIGPWCTDTCSEPNSSRAGHASAVSLSTPYIWNSEMFMFWMNVSSWCKNRSSLLEHANKTNFHKLSK